MTLHQAVRLQRSTPPGKHGIILEQTQVLWLPLRVSLFNIFRVDNVNEYIEFIFLFIHSKTNKQ